MIETEESNEMYSYAFYASATAMFLFSIVFDNIFFLAFAALLISFSALYFSSGHIINTLLLKRGSVIEIVNGYRISETYAAAVKRSGDNFFAVSCVLVKGMAQEYNGELLNSLVANIDFPFEFALGLKSVDKLKLLDGLESKRGMKEIEISRVDQKKLNRVNQLRRELNIIESQIRSIREQKPLALDIRLKATSISANESDAAREASRNAKQLADAFSSSFGMEYEILDGERLLEALA